jgi:hypothetical protein
MATQTTVVAIDMSTSEHDLRVLCPLCAGGSDRRRGSKIIRGEEWGGYDVPACYRCGRTISGLVIVDPRGDQQ